MRLLLFALASMSLAAPLAAELPGDEFFRVETISSGLVDAMAIAVTPDGDIFVIERTGAVKLVDYATGKATQIHTVAVEVRKEEFARECGLLGIALDPGFAKNRWIYLYYSLTGKSAHRLARFTFTGDGLTDERSLLEIPSDRENATCHEGGSLAFGPDGCLYLSTGDNTCPFESDGFAPIDERPGRHWYDAQRTAANTNDLRGKILRLKPTPEGGYTIPEGNLFPKGLAKTRPEIYVMGCRNPYRISIDPKSNYLYWGKVGPDGASDSPRGPRGYDEINQARTAGNFGWPYFSANSQAYAKYDFATETVGEPFVAERPLNHSPNNTGLTDLPPARPAFHFYPRASACAGPVFYADLFPPSSTRLPDAFDQCLITYDWTTAKLGLIKLDDQGDIEWIKPWLAKHRFSHPGDMAFSPTGELYLLEYGSAWYDGTDGKLKKISFTTAPREFVPEPNDPRMAGLPLDHPGTKLIAETTCLACHNTQQSSIGPSYLQVAKRYSGQPEAVKTLAQTILTGGSGAWGAQPMPPHPQHNIEETRQMVEAILKLEPK